MSSLLHLHRALHDRGHPKRAAFVELNRHALVLGVLARLVAVIVAVALVVGML